MDQTESRGFPTAVIASISSGITLCDFSKVHEAAEFLMGHPIWTHHFASKALWLDMQKAVLAECPGMPTVLEGVTKDNYGDFVTDLNARLGATVTIRKGDGATERSPLEGLPDGKPVAVVAA